ncbi:hypothetical protein ACE1OC_18610 [Streptomyces sp. DSM 116496]|uniref:hypothetical protein n=1 Tax=Streptomyces stoeckheimensis TaxID=3344656 RepID=UPI0038B2CFAF
MYLLNSVHDHRNIGEVSKEQLNLLIAFLSDEDDPEPGMYVDYDVLKDLTAIGADRMLIGMLENALGHHSWMRFTWSTKPPFEPLIQVVPATPGRRRGRA